MKEQSVFNNFEELNITQHAKALLAETAKWTKFLSILGFIGIGFIVIVALFAGSILGVLSNAPGMDAFRAVGAGMITVFYLIIALIYFFPVLYLYRFSHKLKNALNSSDNTYLTEAFSNLKSHYKYIGIFAIVMICFYIFVFLIGALLA